MTGRPPTRYSIESLRRQIAAILSAWGMSEAVCAASVDGMLYADTHGIDSHGIAMLPVYEKWHAARRFNPTPAPRFERESAVAALLDGDHAMGYLPATIAIDAAITKARTQGVGAVAVHRSNHFGAAGFYVARAADAGLIAFATTNTVDVAVVPTHAREARFGTNPLAFAAPAAGQPPFLLDMATSTVALGKLMTAAYRGDPVPLGWALDETGEPTTDPARGYAARRATPLGATAAMSSHKGYGLAAMVEILSSALSGARWAPRHAAADSDPRGDVGHFFLVLDPGAFRSPSAIAADVGSMLDILRATPAADPAQPVQTAGDPEYRAFAERSRDGVPLEATLVAALREVTERAGAQWELGGTSSFGRFDTRLLDKA